MNRNRSEARRALLRRLVADGRIAGQDDAIRLLAGKGHRVTQTTVSRDLAAIGAHKSPGDEPAVGYILGGATRVHDGHDELARRMREFVVKISHSGNLAVLLTPPGAAAPVASALDNARPAGVLATIAGDDTVLVVSKTATGGPSVARRLRNIMEGSSS